MKNEDLILEAKKALKFAYAPYSHFKVGAALLTKSGKVYTGCNIENASYGATNCAERTAIFKAISEGEKEFEKMAVVSSKNIHTFPCGICRQVMAEFMPEGEVVFEDTRSIRVIPVKELLPHRFTLD